MVIPCVIFVEENSCPTWYEPRLSGKPEQYQQYEEDRNCYLCKLHRAQFLVLFLDNRKGLFLLSLCRRTSIATKILLKTIKSG